MKYPHPSNAPSGMEPVPTSTTDVDPSAVHRHVDAGAEAFVAAAYEAHHARVFGFLARATRDRSAAEDLLQETYLRLTSQARLGREPIEVRAWLFRVASNLVIERSRRQTTVRRWLGRYGRGEYERMVAPSPEAGVLSRERAAEIDQVLEGLPADARLALLLSSEGFAGHEIAQAIGRSDSATRAMLCRARVRVRLRRDKIAEAAR